MPVLGAVGEGVGGVSTLKYDTVRFSRFPLFDEEGWIKHSDWRVERRPVIALGLSAEAQMLVHRIECVEGEYLGRDGWLYRTLKNGREIEMNHWIPSLHGAGVEPPWMPAA